MTTPQPDPAPAPATPIVPTPIPATPAPATPSAPFTALLRGSLVPSLVLGVLVVVSFLVLQGGRAGLAALLAVTVTVAFLAGGLAVMTRLVNASPISVLSGALAVYLGQILVLAVVIFGLAGADWLDGRSFGIAAFVIAIGWQVCQVVAFVRMRRSVYDAPSTDAAIVPAAGPAAASAPAAAQPGESAGQAGG